ncbi:response regulator transcription factor [Paracraurococcus lichenis]|uniref:Response regulator n=1 Tax=Paracraurococcus lichenis TaxID=3064888 RepID=A0ABT9EB42_9PROT|nr:response regulator [Paracraurococcus sp. LOR1-02]MDO9713352.1 response regulator [Paracraurococcus sp. LOR1-02]
MSEHTADDRLALFVEGEALIAIELEDLLTAEGFVCFSASDSHAVEALPLDNLSVAVVDLGLHGRIEGQSIVRLLRKRIRHLPVVVVTGYDLQQPEADLRGLGGPQPASASLPTRATSGTRCGT